MAAVIDTLLVHVRHVNVTVWTSLDINGTKPGIIRLEHSFNVFRFERGLIRLEVAQDDLPLQRFDTEQLTTKPFRQSVLFVDHEVVSKSCDAVMLDVFEEAERIRIRQRAMLSETFAIVSALNVVEASRIAAIVPGKDATFFIDFATESVAATFRKDLIDVLLGMVAPDQLPERLHRSFL